MAQYELGESWQHRTVYIVDQTSLDSDQYRPWHFSGRNLFGGLLQFQGLSIAKIRFIGNDRVGIGTTGSGP
jgi:hypothetical protein